MKKNMFVAGLAVVMTMAASAQVNGKEEPPKPPPPPKPPVVKTKHVPPPPPPPPAEPTEPPAPPAPPVPVEAVQLSKDFDAFLKRNPSVKSVSWHNEDMIIRLKSGKEERYRLTDAQSKKEAAAKYGELPEAPPPPPPPPPPPAPKPPKKKSTYS